MAEQQLIMPRPLGLQPEEMEVLTPPDRMNMVRWAEENFVLSEKTSEIAGPWSGEYTPYLIEPMIFLSSHGPAEEWISACTQAGKSTLSLIFMGYTVEQNPAPMIIVMPREDDARRRVRTRVRPMFDANPALLRHVGGKSENINIGTETVLDNMIMYLAWSGSAAALSDNPVCNVLLDEVGKYPPQVGKEADPVSLIRKRQRTYRMRSKLLGVTSPVVTGDMFDREWNHGDKRKYWVRCTYCGKWHKLVWKNVKFDKDKNGRAFTPDVYEAGGKARYVCPKCNAAWSELDRARAVSYENSRWVPDCCNLTDGGTLTGPEPVTFRHSRRINSLMLHPRFQTIDGLVAEFVRAELARENGDIRPLQDFVNSQLGEPFKQVGKIIVAEKLRAKKNILPPRAVPTNCVMLVASADYHENEHGNIRIDYEVRAFAPKQLNYVILAGSVDCWEMLEEMVLMEPFPWADDNHEAEELAVITIFADSGFHPDKVYKWCRKFPGIAWPVKGTEYQRTPFVASDLDKVLDRAKRKNRRPYSARFTGMQLITIDVTYFKNIVTTWAETATGEPGSTEFYKDIPDHYFEEFSNEHKVKEKRGNSEIYLWRPKSESAPTHHLDTAVYAAAAAYWNKANLIKSDQEVSRLPAAARRKHRVRLSELPRKRKG